jgi:hypothetical protein
MNFERRGPNAFDENNFPLPGKDLGSAHVGPEEVILVESEESVNLDNSEQSVNSVKDENQPLRQSMKKSFQSEKLFGSSAWSAHVSKFGSNIKAKNAKREERPKGSADLPFGVN